MVPPKRRTLKVPVFIHAPPAKVFRAITEPDWIARWFADAATMDARKGGEYSLMWEGGPTHRGEIRQYVPGRRLTLEWGWPGMDRLGTTRLAMELRAEGDGTVLTFVHSGFGSGRTWQGLYEGAILGWRYFTLNLKSVLETGHDLRSPLDW